MRLRLTIAGMALMCIAIASRADAAPITFESTLLRATLPLSFTQDGVTVTFNGANFFVDTLKNEGGIDLFGSLSGNGLYDILERDAPLVITFSAPVSSIAFDFGVDAGGTATLSALQGGPHGLLLANATFSSSVRDTSPFGFGHATFSGEFDTIVVTRSTADFGVDNVDFTPAAAEVPEPASLVLLGTGVAGMIGKARRRRRQIAAPADAQG
jgi:hypothetical protein